MSYNSIARLAGDTDLKLRLTACAAIEGKGGDFPEGWVESLRWVLAASPGWGDAYSYAVDIGNERPGRDEGVITDGMILAAVQALPAILNPSRT